MNNIARRFLTPLLVMLLAGSLAGCYTLLKHPEVTDDSEDTRIIYYPIGPFPPIIPGPWPMPPPPPPPPPPDRDEPPPPAPPPPPPPTRPIDPKQPEKRATEVKEKEPPGNKTLEIESTKTS